MKNLLTKKNVLIAGLAGVLLFIMAMFPVDLGICGENSYYCRKNLDAAELLLIPFVVFVFFSLITYKMRNEVFEHWIKFAIWGVPALIILTYLILGGASHGGLGIGSSYGSSFDALLSILLYGSFCGISIYRIISKYNQLKHVKE
ncbi:MAG: hypothetical protein Q7S52_02135 [bacterium]|nr:hypothetical protein [bacterium]